MSILIFGGTTEGRQLAQALSRRGVPTAVSVATPLGAEELGELPGITVLVGRRSEEEMADLLSGVDRCVDATHPYAREVSANIAAACRRAGVPLRRLLRKESDAFPCLWADSCAQAAALLAETEGNILLTTGAKEVSAFSGLDPQRLFPRVLPVEESIRACRQAGIPTRNIIALHGPFSLELNLALMAQHRIHYLVTKDGGRAGGFEEKAQAAQEAGAQLVVVRRPGEEGGSLEEVLSWLLHP